MEKAKLAGDGAPVPFPLSSAPRISAICGTAEKSRWIRPPCVPTIPNWSKASTA